MNVIPQKLKDGENAALTTPLTVTGTADELDRELSTTLVTFVSGHLQLKNTLDRAKAEMDAAAKAAQAEARSKAKIPTRKEPPRAETTAAETQKLAQPAKSEPPRTTGLFDTPTPASAQAWAADEDEEIPVDIPESDHFEFDDAA